MLVQYTFLNFSCKSPRHQDLYLPPHPSISTAEHHLGREVSSLNQDDFAGHHESYFPAIWDPH